MDDELMQRDMIEVTKAAGESDGLVLPAGVIKRLCDTALAAHKLKERVEELEKEIEGIYEDMAGESI